LGPKMIRTIWLATICLGVLSTLVVGKAVMTRALSSATERPTDLTIIGTGLTQDALGKADRLEITYVRQEVPAASALQPAEPVVPVAGFASLCPVSQSISELVGDPWAFGMGHSADT
jgi:hypothetical protein